MFRSLNAVIAVGYFIFTAGVASADEPFRPTITVSGSAEIRVAPDEVVLSISVESRKKEVEKAFEDNDEKIRGIIGLLKESGVEAENIRTKVIEVSPIFAERRKGLQMANQQANANPFGEGKDESDTQLTVPLPVGYLAKRGLSVRIKKLDEFEKIYRGLIKSGVNSVEGINFQTSKLREYRDQARLQAVEAAREKAEAMAGELECRLEAVDRVIEQGEHHYGRMQNRISVESPFGGGQSDSLAAGMMEITASVQVVFLLDEVEFDE